MKTHMFIITCFVLSFPFLLNAQTNIEDGLLSDEGYVNVINVESATKEELFDKAKIWFARAFKSANDVIQLDDRENGRLIAKGVIPYNAPAFNPGTKFSGHFSFTLTVETRASRYRYKIEDVYHRSLDDGLSGGFLSNEKPDCGSFNLSARAWRKIKEEAILNFYAIALSLEESMTIKPEDEDW